MLDRRVCLLAVPPQPPSAGHPPAERKQGRLFRGFGARVTGTPCRPTDLTKGPTMPNTQLKTLANLSLAPTRLAVKLAGAAVGGLTRRDGDPSPRPVSVDPVSPPSPSPRPRKPPKDLDDVTIARKVENEAFRGLEGVDHGKVDVNVAEGVVWLRGEVRTPELIKELEARTAAVPEVRGVENLLHLPKTPAPTRSDTPTTQRKTRRSPAPKHRRSAGRAKMNAEGPSPVGQEPSPKQTAARGKGRHPAPLGNTEQPPGGVPKETQGPDAADLDKDPAYQPTDDALKDLKGG